MGELDHPAIVHPDVGVVGADGDELGPPRIDADALGLDKAARVIREIDEDGRLLAVFARVRHPQVVLHDEPVLGGAPEEERHARGRGDALHPAQVAVADQQHVRD